MTTQAELIREVEDLIEQLITNGQSIAAGWVAHTIVDLHQQAIEGAGKDWFVQRAYDAVRGAVRAVARRYSPDGNEPDPQIALPGFARLQKAYLAKRDGEEHFVPIEQLTDEEIDAKIGELDRMSIGCAQHANELRRYRKERRAVA